MKTLLLTALIFMSCSKQMDEAEQPVIPVTENEGYEIPDPYYGETIYLQGYRDIISGCEYEYRIGAAYVYLGIGWERKTMHYSLKRTCGNIKTTIRWESESRLSKAEVKATVRALKPDWELELIIDAVEQ